MKPVGNALYIGDVVHKRLRPVHHALRYRVFSCLLDCNQLAETADKLKLFSYNRFNLFSLFDCDHTDGESLRDYLDDIAQQSGQGKNVTRFMMLCYPRVLGYVFNPLTVYFGLDVQDRVVLTVYEVRNTFSGLQTYVLPARADESGVLHQQCEKEFYVSPFNAVEGRYQFHATPLADDFTLGVALSTSDGPLLKTHFRGQRHSLSDAMLLRALAQTGWMTVKVMAGIHYEALKLFLKGLRPVPRPVMAPKRAITYLGEPKETH